MTILSAGHVYAQVFGATLSGTVTDPSGAANRDVTGFGVAYRYGETSRLHLIERFTRIGANTINYEVTVDDPATFTNPWTASIPMVNREEPLYGYACHEGNYSMEGMLTGSRAQDQSAAAKSGQR